ncbi:MAG: insulinase family protein [Cyclobacteriaceae bacterium]|nr:insulinase family protein [Cyclobacteriaceae bacterium HetDA_MAG_MS6]
MKEYELVELNNGIRLIHKQVENTKIAHLGLMLDIGSRDETNDEQGLAHFWEHMAFKGTQKRKAFHILNRLESLGGELNAYTTKEKICFYASVLQNHLDKAVDLLADITFFSTFPEKQIDREKMVILEEMSMYRDTPEDAIQDDFDEVVFQNHPLGMNILGTEQTVSSFGHDQFLSFIKKHLNTEKIVLSSVGNYTMKSLEKVVRKYLSDVSHKKGEIPRRAFEHFVPTKKSIEKPISQVHHAIGTQTFGLKHESRIPFFLLTNILGGPSLNSRLNLSLREKHGYVYGVEAQYTTYTDVGLFAIFFATDPRNDKRSLSLVHKEIQLIKNKPMGSIQLHKAKQQIKGQLAMSEENNNSMMLMMAKSLLDLGRVPDLNMVFEKIESIGSHQLQQLALDIFNTDQMSHLTFTPGT